MSRRLIIAPSGAGKSHFVRDNPDKAIDGDGLVASHGGWPKPVVGQPPWWETPAADQVRANAWATLEKDASKHELPVLFNDSPTALREEQVFAVVIPTVELVKRNREQRLADGGGKPGTQPTGTDKLEESIAAYAKWAADHKVPTFPTVEAAVAEYGVMMTQNGLLAEEEHDA